MRAVERVHLIDQPDAERLVFGTGAGRARCRQRRDHDAHCNALKRTHDYSPGGVRSGLFQGVEKIAAKNRAPGWRRDRRPDHRFG